MAQSLLQQFAAGLASGKVRIIDLTQPLSEETPLLVLPEPFGQTAAFSRQQISRYDDKGVAWFWNNFTVGEHTGTHFDAPVHWVTGKDLPDNSVDTVPPSDLVAPAVVIDISDRAEADPDYLLTVDDILAFEAQHGFSATSPKSAGSGRAGAGRKRRCAPAGSPAGLCRLERCPGRLATRHPRTAPDPLARGWQHGGGIRIIANANTVGP